MKNILENPEAFKMDLPYDNVYFLIQPSELKQDFKSSWKKSFVFIGIMNIIFTLLLGDMWKKGAPTCVFILFLITILFICHTYQDHKRQKARLKNGYNKIIDLLSDKGNIFIYTLNRIDTKEGINELTMIKDLPNNTTFIFHFSNKIKDDISQGVNQLLYYKSHVASL